MIRVVIAAASIVALASTNASEAVIRQIHHMFDPVSLIVARGTVVHFTNGEDVIHHAYADGSFVFDSGDIPPGGDFAIAFDKLGHVTVRCAIHPQMRVDIDVIE